MKSKPLFAVATIIVSLYLAFVLADNYLIDPKAERFLALKTGAERALNLPVWLNVMYAHVAFATLATAAGAVNFSKTIRARHKTFHRVNGYVYIVSVMLVVLSSGYMAPYSTGGKPVSVAFNMMNIIWPAFTFMSLIRVLKKDIPGHLRWMVRSYVFCFNNFFVHAMTFVVEQGLRLPHETSYSAGVYAAFALNLLLGEIIIRFVFPGTLKVRKTVTSS